MKLPKDFDVYDPGIVDAISKLKAFEDKYRHAHIEFVLEKYEDFGSGKVETRMKLGYNSMQSTPHWHSVGGDMSGVDTVMRSAESVINAELERVYGFDYDGLYGVIKDRKIQIEQQNGGYDLDISNLLVSKAIPLSTEY